MVLFVHTTSNKNIKKILSANAILSSKETKNIGEGEDYSDNPKGA